MIQIFTADNAFEAHLVRGRLEADGLKAEVRGEWLTGAFGELPATGLVSVWVEPQDAERAKALLMRHENFPGMSDEHEPDEHADDSLDDGSNLSVLFA